jgi:hypothetical protein
MRYALRRTILFFSCGFFGAFRDAFDEMDKTFAIRLWPNRRNQLLVVTQALCFLLVRVSGSGE